MMIWYVPQKVPTWLIDSNVIATLSRPPKDPHDDGDEDEEGGGGDEEEDEEPATVREPDDC